MRSVPFAEVTRIYLDVRVTTMSHPDVVSDYFFICYFHGDLDIISGDIKSRRLDNACERNLTKVIRFEVSAINRSIWPNEVGGIYEKIQRAMITYNVSH